ncbi:PA2169 family four-helix-bundle protein [Rhizobiaceae bacterium]|nr:PA2169 family four-helix-bundle protein [Rhizobiaceae bacterium]
MDRLQAKHDALKHLYTRLVDSRDGYERSRKEAETGAHRELFAQQIERRSRNAAEVRGFLAADGVEMDDDGSLLAAAHRSWLSLRDVFSSGDDAVMAEVIRGEEELLSAYDDAIAAAGAGDQELDWLSAQYADLKSVVQGLKADS